MAKDRVDSVDKKTCGPIKDLNSKVNGGDQAQTEGAPDKMRGTGQNVFGGARDTMRDAIKK